ncbi:hypothetical protein C8J56DRAFT_753836, partial [Mycena floridula]
MPMYIVILRLAMLFLNVYDSFKTLKLPPPSARNGGQPSIRAMTQRKRDLKGCLAVWIVWCCFTAYERLLEGIICMFIPFYNEFKALALLFLILTRARGAEPIYLHLIRPMLKPYTPTLDSFLEVAIFMADVMLAVPLRLVGIATSWLQSESSERGSSDYPETDRFTPPPVYQESQEARYLRPQRSTQNIRPEFNQRRPSDHRRSSGENRRLSALDEPTNLPPRFTPPSKSQLRRPSPEIWHPPASSYEDESNMEQEENEWRQYPPFPSAYPATPISSTSRVLAPEAMNSRLTLSSVHYPAIPEEQGFPMSLSPAPEPLRPSSVSSLSDSSTDTRVHVEDSADGDGSSMAVDEDGSRESTSEMSDEDEEDEFNVTLRTPMQIRTISAGLASPISSRSTTLTTNDDGSSLRTPSASS